jgi:hypothetical protein
MEENGFARVFLRCFIQARIPADRRRSGGSDFLLPREHWIASSLRFSQ